MKNSASTKEKFVELRATGMSYEAIAAQVGVTRQTLQTWVKELRPQIENHKALRLDSLRAQYSLLQQHQVEVFGQVLGRMRDELAKRDLSDISTHRLLDLFLKYSIAYNENSKPPELVEEKGSMELDVLFPPTSYVPLPMP